MTLRLLQRSIAWWLWVAAAVAAQPERAATITFVANAENQTAPRVRYSGRAWTVDQGGFLVGAGRGHRLLATAAPEAGDFRVELDLALPRAGRESLLVVGAGSELAIASGSRSWKLRGRFFRAGDAPIEVAAPDVKPGRSFNLVLERRGVVAVLSVDGREVFRGPCSPAAVSELGLDPDLGLVHLYTMAATGRFGPASAGAKPFGNPFGMQLRPAPRDLASVWAPAIVREAPTNEASIVARRDGSLELYAITKPESDSVSVLRSRDGGLTWSEPAIAFRLPGRAYYALVVLEAADGGLHAVYHILGDGPGGYRGRLYEVYHTRRPAGASAWSEPQKVVPGYVGSINGFIQLSGSGRLVLAVARAVPEREQPPASGPDQGWNDTFVYLSDDQGATWRQSPDQLSLVLGAPNVTRYGAIEPVLLELRDGRIWMLVRDRGGRLWQSFSRGGERWTALERTGFISSDSPADLLRLRDGRIVLLTNPCQNWTDPRSYAMGGREVLQAAISADDGRTWRGFREILHETDVVSGGDRGTSYASLAENTAGKVVVVSGQGEGKRAVLLFDPGWLEEAGATNDLAFGPVEWTQYGDDGLKVEKLPDGRAAVAIPLKSTGLCGAQWNFPLAAAGEITIRIEVPAEVRGLRLVLNDHFTRNDDGKAAAHAVYSVPLDPAAAGAAPRARELRLRWTDATRGGQLTLEVDGRPAGTFAAQRPAEFGVNYLRVEFRSSADQGSVRLAGLTSRRTP
ncbi:MAG: exo-alpha-sialidase [Opitutaceae bacterium]|nr:exo-alpha-sialidase [Opitutaceae bacterium]